MKRRRRGSNRRVNKVEPMSTAQWYYTGGEMEGFKTVQQLLRPTDTCTFFAVVQGYLLGLQSPAERLFAIVKHEGSDEHALFMFTVDDMESPPQLLLDKFCAIRGSFQAQIKAIHGSRCNVLLNDGAGSAIMIQLLYSTSITALFISNLNQALQQFAYSPSLNSPSAFHWLHGYEACRTGWDRFAKPSNSHFQKDNSPAPLIQFGGRDDQENGREGPRRVSLPESWPWSHIITPNSDGTTEVAKCESLLQDFDPLHQPDAHRQLPEQLPDGSRPQSQSQPQYQLQTQFPGQEPVAIEVTGTSCEDDVCHLSKPFQTSDPPRPTSGFDDDFNPLLPTTTPSPSLSDPGVTSEPTDLRHCTSDSNLLKLGKRYQTRAYDKMDPLVTRSEEDLTLVDAQGHGNRHCVATTNQDSEKSGSDFCLIDVRTTSPDIDIGQSLNRADTDEKELPVNKHLTKVAQYTQRPYSSVDAVNSSDEEDALDYKTRRVRSTDNSPNVHDHRRTLTAADFQKKHFDFLAPSGSKPGVSKVVFNSPELTRRRRARSRDRASSRAAANLSRNQWVSRYRPGVPIPTESARESIMQAELRHREKEFCTYRELRIFCGTWNVNGRHAPSSLEAFLLEYEVEGEELPPSTPDVFAVAFQELDLSTQALMGQESTREEFWIAAVEQTISIIGKYHKLYSIRLVGMLLLVYIKEELQEHVTDVIADMVPTGMAGVFGNKGAVAIHFNLFHSSLCFVNSHLPAHMEEVERRNQHYHIIQNKMVFDRGTDYAYGLMDHDMVFWLGDLNYRIQTTPEMTLDIIKSYADNYQISRLLKYDQLMQEVARGSVFMFFNEGDIDFKPTYKYDVNTDEWDSSEKARPPAWCDRILRYGKGLKQKSYRSHPKLKISDHKPVSAIYDAKVCVVNSEKEREVLEQITWRLDKLENDTLPQVDLSHTEFQFENVKFMTPQSKRLVVTNTGQRPVHVSFIPKLDEKAYCQPWLEVKPSSAVIQPLEDVTMQVTVLVNENTVLALSKADHNLEDILILHLEKGKDFFISISGNYLLSCFGSSLETLIYLHTYIREVPVARLLDLTQSGLTTSWEEAVATDVPDEPQPAPPALDIPKELYQMVDYINRKGLEAEGLFAEGGRQGELEDIRDYLDTGGARMPGSVNSVAAALLLFLGALEEPVVPVALHQKAMDCCNNATLCKQMLMQMPKVHRRTLAFLITLMKNLLEHSDVNGLEAKVLATIFGDALLRHTREDRKTKSKKQLASMNRKKATFIYQFLVNDLIVSYK